MTESVLVCDVMTHPVMTATAAAFASDAAALLTQCGFTALPVVDDDGVLIGIVTGADLLRARVPHPRRSPLLVGEPAAGLLPRSVGEVMTTDVLSATPWTDVGDLGERMRSQGIRSVPVVGPGGELVGIVSRRDVLERCTHEDERVAADVRHRLDRYARPGRWVVAVHDGVVTLGDAVGDEAEQHIASLLAASVPGVLGVCVDVRRG